MADAPCALTDVKVANAFRSLAEEHALKRSERDREPIWHSVLMQTQVMALQRGRRRRGFGRPGMGWMAIPLAACLSLGVAGVAFWSHEPAGLRYELVGGQIEGGLIKTADETASLEFSDESVVELQQQTEVTVSLVGKHSAVTRLSRGRVQAKVRHSDDTDWRFFAGPYEVRVVGTEFDLGWDPRSRSLALAMHKGWVRVLGPDNMSRVLTAGERLDLKDDRPVAGLIATKKIASDRAIQEGTADSVTANNSPAHTNTRAATGKAPGGSARPSTKQVSLAELVAKGRFEQVVDSATAAGIQSVLDTHRASDLQALAQAASYTGRTSLALRTWKALRQRFPGTSAARQAAFFLGRIYEQRGQMLDAMGWLNSYLAEAPRGVFAAEALGRKMHLVRRLEGVAAGRTVAKEYVRRFPQGAYARAARGMLSED